MTTKNRNTRRLSMEILEDRKVLAGNIQATLANGDLQLTGDDRGNGALVYEVTPESGHYRVEGLDRAGLPTRINGQASIEFRRVFGNLTVQMHGGDDLLRIGKANQTTTNAKVTDIGMGMGDDVVEIAFSKLGRLTIDTYNGNDVVRVTDSSIRYAAAIDAAQGDDKIQLRNVSVGYGLSIAAGQGADEVSLESARAGYDLEIWGGDGDDLIALRNVESAQELRLQAMGGADRVTLDAVAADSVFVALGEGADTLSVANCKAGRGTFSGNLGQDRLTLGLNNRFHSTAIDGFERV